jgi:hypothetical protein
MSVGTKVGTSLGELEDVDVTGDGTGWGSCLQLRVVLDLTKPFDCGKALCFAGKTSLVEFKYNKLPLFCFQCGRIIHETRGCPVPPEKRLKKVETIKQWGLWLRAANPKRRETKGGKSYRGMASRTPTEKEGEMEGGGHVEDGIPSLAKTGAYGNPSQGTSARKPSRSAESGTYVSEQEEGGEIRKDFTSSLLHGSKDINALKGKWMVGHKESSDVGQIMGMETGVQLGLIDEVDGGSLLDIGSEEAGLKTTNMEFIIIEVEETTKGANSGGTNLLRPNIKTWKRMARRGKNDNVVSLPVKKNKKSRKEGTVSIGDEHGKLKKQKKHA